MGAIRGDSPRRAARGGPRATFALATESLRCPCCRQRFYFAHHAGRVWRTQCPSATCAEVLVVSRGHALRHHVERLGSHLRRVVPESPRFFQYIGEHWLEVGIALALMLAIVPMVWASATPFRDALVVGGIVVPAALVCAVAFSWGATRWLHRRGHHDAQRRDAARALGRTPFIEVAASPGWRPEA